MLLGVSLPIVVFEVLGYACLGLCIWHALHQGPLRRALLAISLTMVVVSLILHGWLVQQKLIRRQLPPSQSALSSETFGMKKPPIIPVD
jgi:hypothetical protein